MIHLNSRDPRPIYEQIMDNLRRLIISGGVAPGDRLPSVREMAAQLAINPNTIQRAYRELEGMGLIATVPGKGCFVCGQVDAGAQERQQLLSEFERITQLLLRSGVSKEDLAALIMQGGNDDA